MLRKLVNPALYSCLVAALFAAIGAAVQLAGPPAHADFKPDSSLLVSTRDQLRVCLATHGSVDTGQLAQRLSGSLGIVRQHRQWGVAKYDDVPAPEQNCTANLPATGVTKGVLVGPGLTAEPSPYRTVVVALDEVHARRYLGDQQAVLVPYELMKVGDHVVATVTQAVVVRADFVNDPLFATDYLTPALGLDPTAR